MLRRFTQRGEIFEEESVGSKTKSEEDITLVTAWYENIEFTYHLLFKRNSVKRKKKIVLFKKFNFYRTLKKDRNNNIGQFILNHELKHSIFFFIIKST